MVKEIPLVSNSHRLMPGSWQCVSKENYCRWSKNQIDQEQLWDIIDMIKRDLAKKVITLEVLAGIALFLATGEFRIDTTRTYHGMTLKTMTVSWAITLILFFCKTHFVCHPMRQFIVSMQEVATKTILEPPRKPQAPKGNYTCLFWLIIVYQFSLEVPKPIDFPKPQRKGTQLLEVLQQFISYLVSSDNKSKTPIIIVPLSTTSVVTMLNVQELLEDFKYVYYFTTFDMYYTLRYVSNEDKKASGVKKASELTIHRKKPNLAHPGQTISVPFKVTDNPLRLSPQDW